MDRPIENETHFPLMFANLNFTVMVMTTQVERETHSALEFLFKNAKKNFVHQLGKACIYFFSLIPSVPLQFKKGI